MRQLIKNALKSFSSSKIGLVVLAIIMFITTATVTLFISVSSSFKNSYGSVIEDGKLHDFTVNEKYSVQGDDGLSFEEAPNSQKSISNIKDNPAYTDADFIYIDATDFDKLKWTGPNSPKIRLRKSDLIFKDNDSDGTPDEIVTPSIGISVSSQNPGSHLDVDPILGKDFVVDDNSDSKHFDQLFYSTFWTYDSSVSDNSVLGNMLKFVGNFDDFKSNLLDVLNDKQLVSFINTNTYNFPIDTSVLSGDYKTALKSLTSDNSLAHDSIEKWMNSVIGIERDFSTYDEANEKFKLLKYTLQTKASIGLKDKFRDEITTKYASELYQTDVNSITVNSQKEIFKIVDGQKNKDINQLVMFKGEAPSDSPSELYTDKDGYLLNENGDQIKDTDGNPTKDPNDFRALNKFLLDGVKKAAMATGTFENAKGKQLIYDKRFKYSYSWQKSLLFGHEAPISISYYDPAAFEAVVTPGYLDKHGIKPISPSIVENLIKEGDELIIQKHESFDFSSWIKNKIESKYKDSVVWVDQTPYFITGSGTTPDFSFPIVNGANPIPDTNTQAILFTNPNGYQRIVDAFRGNPKENYLAYRFKKNVSDSRQKEIVSEIEDIAKKSMTWGDNIDHIVSMFDDTTEKVNLAPQRVVFLVKIENTISVISLTTITLLILFTAFVVIIVVKKQISTRKKNLGILMANGYSKNQIASSNMILGLIISVVPSILGYLLGHFFQFTLLHIFDNTWTLPIAGHEFSWFALFTTVAVPIVGISLLSFIITLWELKGSIPSILAGANSKFSDSLSAKILTPLKIVGIRTKASMSLFLSNISKMLMILISSAAATIAISMSVSTINKFTTARNESVASTSYKYKLDLVSPTEEGGAYQAMKISNIGTNNLGIDSPSQQFYSQGVDNAFDVISQPSYSEPNFHVPSSDDEKYQKDNNYLINKVQFKSLLDIFAGNFVFGQGANPWDTARNFMPENQQNIAIRKSINFINKATEIYKSGHEDKLPNFIEKKDGNYTVKVNELNGSLLGFSVSKEYRTFLYNGIYDAIKEYQKSGSVENLPFFISYKNLIVGDNDELYSSIKGQIALKDINGKNTATKLSIVGVDQDTKMINLSSKERESINNYKGNNIPVIANKYFLENYDLHVGSIFDMDITNAKDRYHNGTLGLISHKKKIEIVGTQNSYNDSKLYTNRVIANKALGWDTTKVVGQNMFNGVFTTDDNSVIFNTISLYSQSGYYPSTSTLIEPVSPATSDDQRNPYEVLEDELSANGMPLNPSIRNIDDFITTYTNSPYVLDYSDVSWAQADKYKFDTTLDLSSKLILVIEILVIMMAVLFVAVIASMMVSDNKRFISTMKVMGYRSGEISRIFFGSFIPSLLVALCLAIPISVGLIFALKVAIMSFGSILVPLAITWWAVAISFAIVLVGIWFTYWLSSRELKNTSLLQAFE